MDAQDLRNLYRACLRSVGATVPAGSAAQPKIAVSEFTDDDGTTGWIAEIRFGENRLLAHGMDPRQALQRLEHDVVYRATERIKLLATNLPEPLARE